MPNIVNFIRTDIWRIQLRKTSRKKSFLVKNLRIILLSLRRFNEDKCQLRASALTFYSILSIVPVVENIEYRDVYQSNREPAPDLYRNLSLISKLLLYN